MARFIYRWQNTQHGRRLFRLPGGGAALSAVEPETTTTADEPTTADLGSLKKDELVARAEEQGVDSSGTKADIIARLEADDD